MKIKIGDEMLTQEQKAMNSETWAHIHQVQQYIAKCQLNLGRRALEHDQSKLVAPEVATFCEFTPKLKDCTYGSDEYKGFLEAMAPALKNHYQNNSHHPEHYGEEGINGMNLLDVLEMLCDWLAATKRHADGDINKSFEINQNRFGMSPQLVQIMKNTLQLLEVP